MVKIFDNKPVSYDKETQVDIVDLSAPSYQFGIESCKIDRFGYVSDQMSMRPDLFSGVYSFTEDMQYEILKFNRISNWFSLDEGDILAIPNITQIDDFAYTIEKRSNINNNYSASKDSQRKAMLDVLNPFSKSNIGNNTFDEFKKRYKDLEEEKKYEKLKALQNSDQNNNEELLPPNIAEAGKKEITITPNGSVILGTSVAGTETSCGTKNLTKADLLNSLIKNRIVK